MASQFSGILILYSTVCSGTDQRKHQSFAPLAFVTGEFSTQRTSNMENVYIWWRNHKKLFVKKLLMSVTLTPWMTGTRLFLWDVLAHAKTSAGIVVTKEDRHKTIPFYFIQNTFSTIRLYHSNSGHHLRVLNSLDPGKFWWNFREIFVKLISMIDGWGILWNCTQINVTRSYCW